MLKSQAKVDHNRTVRLGSPGCDGSGIRLGQSVGGSVALMDHCDHSRGIRPDVFTLGMLINPQGERFVNEQAYTGTIGDAVVKAGYKRLWLVVDKELRNRAIGSSLPGRTAGGFFFLGLPVLLSLAFSTKRARTIEGLARKLNVDPATLRATLGSYNRCARGEAIDPFGKDPAAMKSLAKGPFYAIDQSIDSRFAPILAFTTGGLVVDEATGAVKREDGTPIRGLFAAGRTAVGICSISYVSGLSIADCVFSGRRAARSMSPDRTHNQHAKSSD